MKDHFFGGRPRCDDPENGNPFTDYELAWLRAVLDSPTGSSGYGLKTGKERVSECLINVAMRNRFHPIKDMLESLGPYDHRDYNGTALERHLGVPQTVYTTEAFRLMMVAAVARTYEPGHKFDNCLVIVGEQGIGKSTFIEEIAMGRWFDNFNVNFDDPGRAIEKMMGNIFLEFGEMAAYNKGDLESVKSFLSQTEDTHRLAYARTPTHFKRQCVFFGTSNNPEFLRDETGNRRFWPVRSELPYMTLGPARQLLRSEVPMMWAQALHEYRELRRKHPTGPLPLLLSPAAEALARQAQREAKEMTAAEMYAEDIRRGMDRVVMRSELGTDNVADRFDDASDEPDVPMIRNMISRSDIMSDMLGIAKREIKSQMSTVTGAINILEREGFLTVPRTQNGKEAKARFGSGDKERFVVRASLEQNSTFRRAKWVPASVVYPVDDDEIADLIG
ncbi:virulence-associated E family protein [Fulvimarina sp. MAC3]|uniref:virulence-associated E family protein n=1 Tax=Fulvimarina sp. MAC3 TaxID=3148887 RepID=UPI0031FE2FAD